MALVALTAAFSVPSQVETIGAIAGLAAILGLAVLSMLYFAQAREVKRLREWAGRGPERAAELQERAMTPAAPRRAAPQPAPGRPAAQAATPAGQAAQRPPGAPAPGTPATPGAPATAKPATAAAAAAAGAASTPGAPATPTPTPTPANGLAGTPGAAAAPGADDAAKPDSDDTTIGPLPATRGEDQPTTAQPATGAARPATPQPLPVPPTGRAPGARPQVPPARANVPGARPRTAQPLRAGSPSATIPPRGGGRGAPPDGGGHRGRSIALVVGAVVLVLAAGVFAFTQLSGGDDPAPTAGTQTTPGNEIQSPGRTSTTEAGQETTPRGQTTVAVLNGTTVPGLARAVADKLESAGYRIGNVTNAPDQQRAATQVAYAQGHERTARQIARTIDVGSDAVVPVDEVTEATAGTEAVVVVTVGSDQTP